MGEYAQYQGEQIKIGTCESLYYLRADQADMVDPPANDTYPRVVVAELADEAGFGQ